jgi:hypothetical protein
MTRTLGLLSLLLVALLCVGVPAPAAAPPEGQACRDRALLFGEQWPVARVEDERLHREVEPMHRREPGEPLRHAARIEQAPCGADAAVALHRSEVAK